MEHGAWMSTGEDAMQIQVSNPDESWYGQKKSRWAMDAISKLVTAAFASHSAVKPEFGTLSACYLAGVR